jgi:hypothetical protein
MIDAINWHPLGTAGPWRRSDTEDYAEILASDAERAVALVGNASDADAIAEVPAMAQFIGLIARMETATEFDTRTDGDGMSGDDAIETLSSLIDTARIILSRIDGGAA